MGVRVAGDAVYVLLMKSAGLESSSRIRTFDLATGRETWSSAPMRPEKTKDLMMVTPRDWRIGRDYIAVLTHIYARTKVGRGFRSQLKDPMVFCLDRTSGKVVQRLSLKHKSGALGRQHPYNILAMDDMLWVVYYDALVGLKAAR